MTDFVKRIEQTIHACRQMGQYFDKGESLTVLVPEGAHDLAIRDVSNYLNSLPTQTYQWLDPEGGATSICMLFFRGVSCHIIRADVRREIFQVALPTPQPK